MKKCPECGATHNRWDSDVCLICEIEDTLSTRPSVVSFQGVKVPPREEFDGPEISVASS